MELLKFYARKLILECIPPHTYYCEPFAGGASIFFAKTKARQNWLNDLDKELINCYRFIQESPESIIKVLEGARPSKETHYYFKNVFNPSSDLERAARWFFLNRTSYSGIMQQENCYFGYGDKYSMRPENWLNHLKTCSEKLQNVKFTTCDFEKIINEVPDGAFLFIDPPYFGADQDKFYTCYFSKEDHYRLNKILKCHAKRIRFLITYDNVEEVRNIYDWAAARLDREWNYMLNRTDDQKNGRKLVDGFRSNRYKGREIFILNYKVDESLMGYKSDEDIRQEKFHGSDARQLLFNA
ncbi:MAG: DNA adenine methylase [Elusimicrobia bacterium]|nr:DNA adenine methylase [Elusimicrobiota bacterium]